MNPFGTEATAEFQVAFTKEELERLLHEANNRACGHQSLGLEGDENPWNAIRLKLLAAIKSAKRS